MELRDFYKSLENLRDETRRGGNATSGSRQRFAKGGRAKRKANDNDDADVAPGPKRQQLAPPPRPPSGRSALLKQQQQDRDKVEAAKQQSLQNGVEQGKAMRRSKEVASKALRQAELADQEAALAARPALIPNDALRRLPMGPEHFTLQRHRLSCTHNAIDHIAEANGTLPQLRAPRDYETLSDTGEDHTRRRFEELLPNRQRRYKKWLDRGHADLQKYGAYDDDGGTKRTNLRTRGALDPLTYRGNPHNNQDGTRSKRNLNLEGSNIRHLAPAYNLAVEDQPLSSQGFTSITPTQPGALDFSCIGVGGKPRGRHLGVVWGDPKSSKHVYVNTGLVPRAERADRKRAADREFGFDDRPIDKSQENQGRRPSLPEHVPIQALLDSADPTKPVVGLNSGNFRLRNIHTFKHDPAPP